MISINTNTDSMFAQRQLARATEDVAASIQRLSSGLRINSARDDPAGIAIASRMTSELRGLRQSGRNINDGISMMQVAEGTVATAADMFQRIRELAVQAASDTNAVDRPIIQVEVSALLLEIRRMSEDTMFNGSRLLDGSGQFGLQVGAHGGQLLGLNIPGLWVSTDADIDLRSHQGATDALSYLDTRLAEISKSRTLLGAYQSRLGFAADHAAMMAEQQEAALSRIQDLDYAAEVGKLTRAQILQQAAASMLAQANSAPRLILQLLR